MSGRKRDSRINRSLFSVRQYLLFFALISFIVTCCMVLFLKTLNIELTDIRESAIKTFINVIILSLICTIVDGIRRKFTVERPLRRILKATHDLTGGDFSARIAPFHRFESVNEFDAIIDDFNKMAKELSGIETLRSDFIASVSHELKTPLSVISSYATMLSAPALSEEKRMEYAKTVASASRRLSELITNILRLNKLENQQIFPDSAAFNLGEQLRECLLGFEDLWEKKNLTIETDIDDVTTQADAELLSLVWNNLFSNAVKFTEHGGKISVSLKIDGDDALIQVSDTGCGIPPDVGQHIFDKFYQGDSSRAASGNGLGLALVKRVIDIMGGDISVKSTAGQGSTFTVRLRGDADAKA